jgi:uncharacterized protein DUF3105
MATPERTDKERRESDRRRLGQLIAFAFVGVAVGAVWIIAVTGTSGGPKPTGGSPDVYPNATVPAPSNRSLTSAAAAAGCTVRSFPNFGREHTKDRVKYKTNPPTSGPHYPVPAPDGIYDDPPAASRLVHSLEHGRIIFQFAPGAPGRVRGQLKALVKEDDRHVILTPNNTGMPFLVAATAWRHYIGCTRSSDGMWDALRDFKIAYRDRAPEQVP